MIENISFYKKNGTFCELFFYIPNRCCQSEIALERAGVQLDAPDPVQHVFGKYRSKRAHGASDVRAHVPAGLQPLAGQPLGVGRLRAYADENVGCPGHRMAAYWTTRMGAGGQA